MSSMKNFHVPLSDDTYLHLRSVSEATKVPATTLARQAIDAWLLDWARRERHLAIAQYASEMAGTELDLDDELEAAAIEHLLNTRG
jgi:hypothetical protein